MHPPSCCRPLWVHLGLPPRSESSPRPAHTVGSTTLKTQKEGRVHIWQLQGSRNSGCDCKRTVSLEPDNAECVPNQGFWPAQIPQPHPDIDQDASASGPGCLWAHKTSRLAWHPPSQQQSIDAPACYSGGSQRCLCQEGQSESGRVQIEELSLGRARHQQSQCCGPRLQLTLPGVA